MASDSKAQSSKGHSEDLLTLREAALELRIAFPTIKPWIYKRKVRSIPTAGGHHRIPQSEVLRRKADDPTRGSGACSIPVHFSIVRSTGPHCSCRCRPAVRHARYCRSISEADGEKRPCHLRIVRQLLPAGSKWSSVRHVLLR